MKQNLSRINRIVVGAVGLTAAGMVLGGGVASATIPGIDDINDTGTFVQDLTITGNPGAPTNPLDQTFSAETTPGVTDGVTGQLTPGGGVTGTFTNVDEATGGSSSFSVNVGPNGIGGFGVGSTDPNGNTFNGTVSPGGGSATFGFPL